MIRGDWRDFGGGPQPSLPLRAVSALFAGVVFVAWASGTALILLVLRFLL
jgi:hypothetical protein